jgi:CRISPR-associated protein Cas1
MLMSTLYVDRKGISIRVDANTLVFEEGGSRVGCVPLGPLERVILRGDVSLQASVLGKLGECGVGVVVLSGRKGEPTLLMGRPHNDARRRLRQGQRAQDPTFSLTVAREIVRLKLVAQENLMLDRAKDNLMHKYELRLAASRIRFSKESAEKVSSISSLRGCEGAAANAYFGGLKALFPPALKFTGRNRRPPRDPVNAVLSLGYTLLHSEAVLQTHAAGLDPFVGFLHELDFGRESLACDLVEPQRTGVDRLVLNMFRERQLTPDHFSMVQQACMLGKAGRERFYRVWESASEGMRQALRASCLSLVQVIEAENGDETESQPD